MKLEKIKKVGLFPKGHRFMKQGNAQEISEFQSSAVMSGGRDLQIQAARPG